VALFFFPQTRRFFDGWFRCLVASVLTQVFAVAVLSIFYVVIRGIVQQYAATFQDGMLTGSAERILMLFSVCASAVMFVWMTHYVFRIAHDIAGGAHAQFGGFFVGRQVTSPVSAMLGAGTHPSAPGGNAGPQAAPGGSAGAQGGQGSGSSGTGPQASRDYAFNRKVGPVR
jgi:type IV secretory pathway TrbL component